MADNYLERKMEELRNAPRTSRSARPASSAAGTMPRAGKITFPMPRKRVLISGLGGALLPELIDAFSKTDCRVALFSSDKVTGETMAYDSGIRFHHADTENPQNIASEFQSLLKAWRGVDMIICSPELDNALAEVWRAHLDRFSFPDSYGSRMITISDDETLPQKGTAGDIARTILFLTSPANCFTDGAEVIAGGCSILRFRHI